MARIAYQSDLDKVVLSTRRRIARLVNEMRAESIDPVEFGDRMAILLEDRHGRAAALGRQRAGDTTPRNASDDLLAAEVVDVEAEYLDAFVKKLQAGGYTDSESGLTDWRRVQDRAISYTEKLS